MELEGYHRLDALQQRIADGVRALPGARALHLFGSRLTLPTDPYADLDLHIVTDDLATTRRFWPQFLACVAPIRVAWPITPSADNTAFAVLFAGEQLYHKVDISLSAAPQHAHATATAPGYRVLWEQSAPTAAIPPARAQPYIPLAGTVGHALLNDLLGSIRYVKARKRHQPATCWRFIRGKPALLLQLYAEHQQKWRTDLPALSTWAYKALDDQHDPFVDAVLQHLDWSSPYHMDTNFSWFTQHIIRLFVAKAAARQEVIPHDLVADHVQCIVCELHYESS